MRLEPRTPGLRVKHFTTDSRGTRIIAKDLTKQQREKNRKRRQSRRKSISVRHNDNEEIYEDDTILNCTAIQISQQPTSPNQNSNMQEATLQSSQPLFQLQNICKPKMIDETNVNRYVDPEETIIGGVNSQSLADVSLIQGNQDLDASFIFNQNVNKHF